MITSIPLNIANGVGFHIDGPVDETGLQRLLSEVETRKNMHGKVRILIVFERMGGWDSFRAFWSNLRGKAQLWNAVEKYAIVTDKEWIDRLADMADWVAPQMDIETFRLAQRTEAEAWLAAPPRKPLARAIHLQHTDEDRILAIGVNGKLTAADYEKLDALLNHQYDRYGKLRILLHIEDLQGITLRAFWEDLRTGIRNYSKIERVAVLGSQNWLKPAVKISDLISPGIDMQFFPETDRQRAIGWLL